MDIVYNNQWDYNDVNYLTLTEIPNIVKVQEYIQGTKANFEIDLEGNLQSTVSGDGQYYCTLLGETITSTMSPSNAKNKRFFISADEDSTAYSMCQAFRNCSSLAAQFNIIYGGSSIYFVSKSLGTIFNQSGYFKTNIPNQYLTASSQDGSVNSDLFNGKITLDVYSADTTSSHENYVTTLEKNFYGDECAFDVSPVLATFSEYGKTVPYCFNIDMTKGVGRNQGDWQHLGTVSGYTTIGYHANQSEKMLTMEGVQMLMHNVREGKPLIRYVYGNTIPYSLLIGKNNGGWSYSVSYKDSAFNELYNTGTQTDRRYDNSYIADRGITIPSFVKSTAYYVDITLGTETYRFNVIKPLKATEYYQRVEWRNEYGGISFFDFTGAKTETDNVNIETYEKNVFDYHQNASEFERKKIYKNQYEKTVKLSSHLMEEQGKWIFNSLMLSKKVWTYVNGKKYYIIPKSVEVNEDNTYNNIYKATLTYTYSDI